MLASSLASGDYLSIGLVVTIIAAVVAVLRETHKTRTDAAKQRVDDQKADTKRHHELDKRIDRQEQRAELAPAVEKLTTVLERILDRDHPRGSGVYPRRPSDGD